MENSVQTRGEELTPEEAKALLGFSTALQEEFMTMQMAQEQQMMGGMEGEEAQQQSPEAPVSPQEPQGEELPQEMNKEPQIDIEALKKELKKELVDEVRKEVMEEIKDALSDEDK